MRPRYNTIFLCFLVLLIVYGVAHHVSPQINYRCNYRPLLHFSPVAVVYSIDRSAKDTPYEVVANTLEMNLPTLGFKIVSRNDIKSVLNEQILQLSGLTEQQLIKLGKIAGARAIIVINVTNYAKIVHLEDMLLGFFGEGARVSFFIKMLDVETANVLWSAFAQFPEDVDATPEMATQVLVNAIMEKMQECLHSGKPNLGEYNEAINRLSATDWFEKGYALGTAGRHQESMDAYTRAIELNPRYASAYSNRCLAYTNLGEHRQAIRDCDRAIELDPKFAAAYSNRGNAYCELGENRRAIRDYDKAIELNPNDVSAYHNRGSAYARLGEHRQAIRDYDRAIELNPKIAEPYHNRGIAYAALRDYRQAIKDLQIAARLGHKGAQDYLKSQGIGW